MKFIRWGPVHHEKPGMVGPDGTLYDVSSLISTVEPERFMGRDLEAKYHFQIEQLPVLPPDVRLGVPIEGISKLIGIGLNYYDHAKEAQMPVPEEPVIFLKAISSLHGPNDVIVIPPDAYKVDWEVELGIVIGRQASYVAEADVFNHIAGYLVVHDVSERSFQLERGGTWDKGKGCDTFAPLGPWFVTSDEIKDPQCLDLWLDVNGVRRQQGNTQNMIFSCAEIVSYVSRFMTLFPGDVIATGTPPGVGMGMTPPVFLQKGDTVSLGISGLGIQTQKVQ